MSAKTRAGGWLAALALVFVPFASERFETPRLVMVALAAVLLVSGARAPGRALSGLLLAWVGVALVGTLSSASLALSFPALVAVVALAAFGVGASAFEPWPLLVVAWPIAGYALVQRAGVDPLPWTAQATWCGAVRPFSTLGHPGQLAGWVSLVLPLALDEAAERQGSRRWMRDGRTTDKNLQLNISLLPEIILQKPSASSTSTHAAMPRHYVWMNSHWGASHSPVLWSVMIGTATCSFS